MSEQHDCEEVEMEQFLTAREVADWLRVGLSTVQHMGSNGTLPTITIGRARRYTRSGVERYIERNRCGGEAGDERGDLAGDGDRGGDAVRDRGTAARTAA